MSSNPQHAQESTILRALEKRFPGPQAFRALSAPVWRDGALSEKHKHLIAVAVAQITRCAFCIEHHAALARKLGATQEEALAVSYISAAAEALGDASVIVTEGLVTVVDEPALAGSAIADARAQFLQQVLADEALASGLHWIVAATVAYAQEKEGRRVAFQQEALAHGASRAAIDEAYAIAVVLRSGAVYSHTFHVAAAFQD